MSNDPSLQELAADYFVRDLSPDELQRLQEALRTDPGLRNQFADLASDEWLLSHIHSDMNQQYVRETKVVKFPKPVSSSRIFLRVAALAILSFAVAALYVSNRPEQQPVAQSEPVAPLQTEEVTVRSAPRQIATVTQMFNLANDNILATNAGESRPIIEGSSLLVGDTITVPKGARLAFQYAGDRTSVKLRSGSRVRLTETDGAKAIHLESGTLYARVAPQPEGRPMRITTRDAEARILGTAFDISVKDDSTRLAVVSGKVAFSSLDQQHQVEVGAGKLSRSSGSTPWTTQVFQIAKLQPVFDQTINEEKESDFIAVDPKRNYMGFLRFDLGQVSGTPTEAKLRLRVMQHMMDWGGRGTVHLYALPASANTRSAAQEEGIEIASYTGRVDAGMDLEFTFDATRLHDGINAFLIKLDRNGNDFWFSSSEGPNPPDLTLITTTHLN